MYLLMMLATFISAIYGFNLSVRPDYDRDIMRKKATSMLYRFNFQAYITSRIVSKIEFYHQLDGEDYPFGIQPGDEIYSSGDKQLTYKQGSHEHAFIVQGDNTTEQASLHLLPEGRSLYGSGEMRSRIYCLPYNSAVNRYYDLNDYDGNYHAETLTGVNEDGEQLVDQPPQNGKQNCDSDAEEGVFTGSCCQKNTHRYLITFRKMDARWINRLTNYMNYDFQRALIEYPFTENIGYVYKDSSNHWHFEGRIRLLPAYIDDMRAWAVSHANETDINKRQFPLKYRNKTAWDLPVGFFTPDFFNVNGEDYCAQGCLIKIRQI